MLSFGRNRMMTDFVQMVKFLMVVDETRFCGYEMYDKWFESLT